MARRYPSRYFGENELSAGLITLSVLPTSHPLSFQPKWVRSSTQFNPRFNLPMGRSHSFRVCSTRQNALFRLGFPWASFRKNLTKPFTTTRRIIMQKARRHPLSSKLDHRAPTACRHMVSGSHSSPSRGSSHPSLTLLVRYRSLRSI